MGGGGGEGGSLDWLLAEARPREVHGPLRCVLHLLTSRVVPLNAAQAEDTVGLISCRVAIILSEDAAIVMSS